ncbi:hypothetical protein ACOME3_004653 [Neoechinorhynchus agilis]
MQELSAIKGAFNKSYLDSMSWRYLHYLRRPTEKQQNKCKSLLEFGLRPVNIARGPDQLFRVMSTMLHGNTTPSLKVIEKIINVINTHQSDMRKLALRTADY